MERPKRSMDSYWENLPEVAEKTTQIQAPDAQGGMMGARVLDMETEQTTTTPQKNGLDLQQSTYLQDIEATEKLAEEQRKKQEQEARRKRDLAMLGDLAGLAVNTGAAFGGGAIEQEMATKAASERLQAIREKNAAQIADYARRKALEKEQARQQRNKEIVEEHNRKIAEETRQRAIDKATTEETRAQEKHAADIKRTEAQINETNARAKYYEDGGGRRESTKTPKVKTYSGKEYNLDTDDDYRKLYHTMALEGLGIKVENPETAQLELKSNPGISEIKNYIDNYFAKEEVGGDIIEWVPGGNKDVINYVPRKK